MRAKTRTISEPIIQTCCKVLSFFKSFFTSTNAYYPTWQSSALVPEANSKHLLTITLARFMLQLQGSCSYLNFGFSAFIEVYK